LEVRILKFDVPQTDEEKRVMHEKEQRRVQAFISDVVVARDRLKPEVEKRRASGGDDSQAEQALRNLRRQELCLKDQDKRLGEKIASLRR
jgi:hypothetical protein